MLTVTKIRTYSRKKDKLRIIYTIGKGVRNISIKRLENNYFKIKIFSFIVFYMKCGICYGHISSPNTELQ